MKVRPLLCAALWACGSNATTPPGALSPGSSDMANDAQTGADTSSDAAATSSDAVITDDGISDDAIPAEGGGFCCPPSKSPACCMSFGGWASAAVACGPLCDGFRLPTKRSTDSHGCDVWTGAAGPICGAASPGPDASNDAFDGSPSEGGADMAASDASCGDVFLSSLGKTCAGDTDCTTANHNDCCGTVVLGIRVGTETSFASAESAFQSCVPGCGLRGCFHATWAESGPANADAGAIVVHCDTGACTTRFQ
jgi:hypothetical protein